MWNVDRAPCRFFGEQELAFLPESRLGKVPSPEGVADVPAQLKTAGVIGMVDNEWGYLS